MSPFFTSKQDAWSFLFSVPKASYQYLVRPIRDASESSQNKLIRAFYRTHRQEPEKVDIADNSTGLLTQMLQYALTKYSADCSHFVDLGCGNGSAMALLPEKNIRYTGIDLYIDNVSQDDLHEFIEADISGNLKIVRDSKNQTLFLAANLLCYLQDLSSITSFLDSNVQSSDYLIVVEPTGTLFWETYFDGIRLSVRSKQDLVLPFQKSGWTFVEETGLFLKELSGRPFLQVSRLLVFKRA